MKNQGQLREVTVSVLASVRAQFPEKTFFIKRRSTEELGICGFVHGTAYPETLFFTVKDNLSVEVNTEMPEEECATAFQSAADALLSLKLEEALLDLMNQQESFNSKKINTFA